MGRRNLRIAHVALVLMMAISGVHGIPSEDSKYDFGTTIFSPKGRLYQVEYASEAVNRARPAVGICTDEGAVLCSLKTIYNTRLQVGDRREKTSLLDSHVVCASAGLTADMMVLVRDCRASAQQHYMTFQEPIPVQKLATHIADVKQAYTQHGGLRPWGVSMLLAGYDTYRGVQLYKTEPSGNFGAFKAVAVGAGARRLSSRLASGYREKMGLAEAVRLAASVLDGERKRELRAQDKGIEGSNEFRGIEMEVATVAVEKGQEGAACSVYLYDDADVERLLESLSKDKMETDLEAPQRGDGDA